MDKKANYVKMCKKLEERGYIKNIGNVPIGNLKRLLKEDWIN